MKAYNIQWDTESRAEFNLLPKEVVIPKGMTDEEEISDYPAFPWNQRRKIFYE